MSNTDEDRLDEELLNNEEYRQSLLDLIPSFDSFENHKENIQPLKQGRRATVLAALFSADQQERDKALQRCHENFDSQLESIDDHDDPLSVYVNYIRFTMEMYPQGNNEESNLVNLLHEATRRFENSERYRTDLRYLNVWMQYAKHVEEPKEIYLLLMQKGIGQKLARFYEEYADYYERRGKYEEAKQVYDYGIQNNAEPLKRLERNRQRFMNRMEQRRKLGQPATPVSRSREQRQNLERTGQRTMLGHRLDGPSSPSVPAHVYNAIQSQSLPSSSSSNPSATSQRPFGNSSPRKSPPTGGGFTVFIDAPPSTEPYASIRPPSSEKPSSRSSDTLNLFPSKRRENMPVVSKFAGTTLPMRNYAPPKIERFKVYCDKEAEGSQLNSVEISQNMVSGYAFYQRYNTAQDPAATKAWFEQMKPKFIESTDSKGRIEYIAAIKEQLGNEGITGVEVSFEELRASQKRYQIKPAEEDELLKRFQKYKQKQDKPESQPTAQYTTETLAAMRIVNEMFQPDKRKEHNTDEEDGDSIWIPGAIKIKRTKISNENDDDVEHNNEPQSE
ncbi:hypothetical protein EC973_000148 [Apophysomyces ossiformis]|uniref:BUB1 N-terminal domain-containing protein n=1 Tax=Apophysomyces ossiformis TaxID=679940 RepID=A0A8H7BZG9_9FUNG|nr:hypothetical protein EC973_000148 [Apophysomyces ossiformis]